METEVCEVGQSVVFRTQIWQVLLEVSSEGGVTPSGRHLFSTFLLGICIHEEWIHITK